MWPVLKVPHNRKHLDKISNAAAVENASSSSRYAIHIDLGDVLPRQVQCTLTHPTTDYYHTPSD